MDDLPGVGLIIDCGANVGCTSAYFLTRFPNCQIIAIEPDPSNFAMLQRNMADYGERVKLVHAGVWSRSAPLVLATEPYGDGGEWSKQVRPCRADEKADFKGVGLDSLLADSGFDRISLLKMDVEGAEAVIFSENVESWLGKVDAIAIELHDDSSFGKASDVFFSAISGQKFQISRSRELTICRRRAA
jgi:FkbM family methyltransferase